MRFNINVQRRFQTLSQVNKSRSFIFLIYCFSHGLVAISINGIWWDDWTLFYTSDETIRHIFKQSASFPPYAGNLHVLLTSLGSFYYRAVTFACFYFSSLNFLELIKRYTRCSEQHALLFTILFYVFVYTIWLKRKTPQNIVIGGAAGALPPVIGWTIATNSLSLEPITFFLIIFFWTPSHFWALSLYKSDDYKKAKIPMLPLTNGIESTKINILVYSLLMLPMVILPYAIDFVGLVFLVPALMLTLYYNFLCFELYMYKKNKFNPKKAKTIFGYSILYLFLIFVIFLIDKIL